LRSSRRVARYAATGMSVAILALFAPNAMIAQQTPGLDYRAPASLTANSMARLRLGVSTREIRGDERAVSPTTTSRAYWRSDNYNPVGLDSAAASHVRQRLTHTTIGAVSGAAIGAAIGALVAARPAGQGCHDLCSNRGIGVVYFGAVGLLTGAVIGAVWPTR